MAQGLLDLLPATNSTFNVNFTTQDVANSLFDAMGIPLDNNCAYQAILVDTGSKLRVGAFPVRTAWARSALLWHLIQTTDTSAISNIQAFLENVDFAALGSDGVVDKPGYQIASSGFVFDFAKMTTSIESVSWRSESQSSDDEASKVTDTLSAVLDMMYSNALGKLRYFMLRWGNSQVGICFAQLDLRNIKQHSLTTGSHPSARSQMISPGSWLSSLGLPS